MFRATLLTVAIAAGAACHDASAPLQPVNYVLTSINGVPVPTTMTPIPESPTVLSGSFFLDGGSHAVAHERRRDLSGNEYDWDVRYRYTITGNVVTFNYDPPCGGPAADCAIIPKGTVDGLHLSIDYSGGQNLAVYDYQTFPMIDLPD
jgi:hypothetical protein